jgi:hypothetical protein
LDKQSDLGWTDAQLLAYIRSATRDAEEENEAVVRRIKIAAQYQLLLAGLAATLAVISLFQAPA